MLLNNDQNIVFATHPDVIRAHKELDEAVKHIQACLKSDGNAEYYLIVLPMWLQKLSSANENMILTEARVTAEILKSCGT